MKELQIRSMREDDLNEIISLERKFFSSPWSVKSFRDAMASSDNCYLTAVFRDKIVGYCGFWCSCDCADLCNLAVSETFRKQDIGSELLRQGIAVVQGRGVCRILLEVRRSNMPAIALYNKFGFENIGVRPGYYSNPKEDGILMERQLSHSDC